MLSYHVLVLVLIGRNEGMFQRWRSTGRPFPLFLARELHRVVQQYEPVVVSREV